MTPTEPIQSKTDYDKALAEIEIYFKREPELGTPEADRFDALAAAIEQYENEHYPMGADGC